MKSAWVILRVTARQERFVVGALAEHGILAYAPLHVTEARFAKRKATRSRPLIPSYVFANLEDDHSIFVAQEIRGVIAIMCDTEGVPRRMPLEWIGALVLADACHWFDETWKPPPIKGRRYSHRWKPKDRVRVRSGLMEGHIAEVIRTEGRNRVAVLLTIFGRSQEVSFEQKDLDNAPHTQDVASKRAA